MIGTETAVCVREATPEDAELIASLIQAAAPESFSATGTRAEIDQWLEVNASVIMLRKRLSSPTTTVILAGHESGVPDATGYLQLRDRQSGHKSVGYIGGVHVRDREKGLGTAVLEDLIGRARAEKAASVRLDVEEHNAPMLHLCRKLGFNAVGNYKDAWFFPRGVFLSLELDLAQ